MVLQVDFENLAEEVKRHGLKPWVYVARNGQKSIITAADPHHQIVIQCESAESLAKTQESLTKQGLLCASGRWVPDPLAGELQIEESMWITSIAYKSSETKPGLWVHAYRGQPSPGDVLKDFFDEMCAETGLVDFPMEKFLAETEPNVVILGPSELEAFIAQCR